MDFKSYYIWLKPLRDKILKPLRDIKCYFSSIVYYFKIEINFSFRICVFFGLLNVQRF